MANPPLSDEIKRQTLAAIETHGSAAAAARALGIPRQTFNSRYMRAKTEQPHSPLLEMPSFVIDGDEDEPIDQVIARQRKAFERKQQAAQERKWFPIKVKETKPYGIVWFGDPHLDNGGANWPLLERHVAVCRQPGIYAGNIGDTLDNWPWTGRLARLHAESEVSNKTAKRIAEWFMFDAGINWLMWLIGNHDEWNGGTEFYKRLGASYIPILDWRAQFKLVHNNGSETRIDAAHGRKGNSLYNPAHGTLRDAKFGEQADLFVTGHIHSFKLDHYEMPERGETTWLAQVRGYKFFDHHAVANGYAEYENGAAIMSIIDPDTGKVQCFADVEEGAEYLSWKRGRG